MGDLQDARTLAPLQTHFSASVHHIFDRCLTILSNVSRDAKLHEGCPSLQLQLSHMFLLELINLLSDRHFFNVWQKNE